MQVITDLASIIYLTKIKAPAIGVVDFRIPKN
jgi:hypothetical protein